MKIDRGLEEEHMTLTGTQDQDSVFKALTIQSSHFIDDMADVEYRVEEFVLFEPSFQIDTGAEFLSVIDTFPPAGIQYFFALKDHLGSNRLIFFDEDDNGSIDTTEIVDESHYYPFGMDFYGDFYEKSSTFKYQYNAKELYTELDLGYYDYGARFYDPSVGRFLSVDPISNLENQEQWSPYHYVLDNPILWTDPQGLSPDTIKINYESFWNFPINHVTLINVDEKSGKSEVIVEGYPENQIFEFKEFLKSGFGNLQSEILTLEGELKEDNLETVPTPEGMTDDEFLKAVQDAFKSYDNGVNYELFPEEGEGNSNSLVGSVLRAAGSNFKPSRNVPGFYKNVLPGNRPLAKKKLSEPRFIRFGEN